MEINERKVPVISGKGATVRHLSAGITTLSFSPPQYSSTAETIRAIQQHEVEVLAPFRTRVWEYFVTPLLRKHFKLRKRETPQQRRARKQNPAGTKIARLALNSAIGIRCNTRLGGLV